MNSKLRWAIAIFGWIILLLVYGIWRDIEKHTGGNLITAVIRGAIVFGGIYFLYMWAKKENPGATAIQARERATKSNDKTEIKNNGKTIESKSIENKKIDENKFIEEGCSQEAIDYLKNPIHIYSYMQKYKITEEKILEAIKKGRLRGCYVNEALWVENKKI